MEEPKMNKKQLSNLIDKNIKTYEFTDKDREKFTVNFKCYRNLYENVEKIYELAPLYDNMKRELKRLPGWREYCNRYCKISWDKCKEYPLDKQEQLLMKQAIAWRASRSWIAMNVENFLTLQLLEWGYDIVEHRYIDIAMGVDIVAIDNEGRLTYIHVTKNTEYALSKVEKKEKYNSHLGGRVSFQRDFTNHLVLAYDPKESKRNRIIHGIPAFRKEYVLNQMGTVKEHETIEDNRLTELAWACRKVVARQGTGFTSHDGVEFKPKRK